MKTWIKEVKAKCAVNARVAKIRTLQRGIEALETNMAKNKQRVALLKAEMMEINGYQLDLFIDHSKGQINR